MSCADKFKIVSYFLSYQIQCIWPCFRVSSHGVEQPELRRQNMHGAEGRAREVTKPFGRIQKTTSESQIVDI